MDAVISFLTEYGYWGMLLSAFIAGSFFPMSSEVMMIGLMAAGLNPWILLIYGTIGNVAGGMFNYFIGSLGRLDWIEKYLHVKKESLEKAKRFTSGRGAWMGFFAFVPILGSALTIALGLMRANLLISFLSIAMGKFLRYLLLVLGVSPFI
ncbi:MAG: DedA family protein [Prevotella sp.]|nr:DedA family protein [Prevotella sp.]